MGEHEGSPSYFYLLNIYIHSDASLVSLGLGIMSKRVLKNLYFMCFVSIPIETHPLLKAISVLN